jgi:hypothetical protein
MRLINQSRKYGTPSQFLSLRSLLTFIFVFVRIKRMRALLVHEGILMEDFQLLPSSPAWHTVHIRLIE